MASLPITLGVVSKVRRQWDAGQCNDRELIHPKAQQGSYNSKYDSGHNFKIDISEIAKKQRAIIAVVTA